MLIKKFIGKSIEQIERAINEELGPDAIVMMTRKIDRGLISSLLREDEIEVTVGIDKEALKKYNPAYENFEEFEALTLMPFHASTRVDCSGPISAGEQGVKVIALAGIHSEALIDSSVKLIQYFHKESPYRAALLYVQQLSELLPSSLYELTEKHKIPFDNLIDRYSLIEKIQKYKDYDFLVTCFPASMHATHILTFLENITPLCVELVARDGEDVSSYKTLLPFGVIINNLESTTAYHELPALVEELKIPISFVANSDRLVLSNADELEALIINSRLNS